MSSACAINERLSPFKAYTVSLRPRAAHPMKKIYLLVLRSYIGPLLMTFFIAVFILLMQFLWKYVDDLVGKGLDWDIIAKLLFYASFTFVPMALPLSILLASLMTFGNLGERYELVAIKAAGISLRWVMMPLVILSVVISVLAFFYSNNVLPVANLKFKSILYDVTQQKLALNLKEGVFYSGINGYVMRIGKKDADNITIHKVMIYDHSSNQGNTKLTLADSGRMEQSADGSFLLLTLWKGFNYEEQVDRMNESKRPFQRTRFEEQFRKFDLSGFKMARTNEEFFKKNYQMLNLRQLQTAIDSLDKDLVNKFTDVETSLMSNYYCLQQAKLIDSLLAKKPTKANNNLLAKYSKPMRTRIVEFALSSARNTKSNIGYNKETLRDKELTLSRREIEWHRKFTLSLACLVLFFIGAPMGVIIRKGGLGLPLVIAVLFFVIYYVISLTGEKAAKGEVLDPFTGMWLSTIILFPIGIFLTYKASTDAPLMDADAYKKFISNVASFLKIQKKHDEAQQE
jgi:lipopolysaccharide export system permease protein